MKIHAIPPVLALAVLVGLGSAGCDKKLKNTIIPNQPPTVRLTWAPIDTKSRVFYVYRLSWVGYDPDGRVARFEYAIDPPTETGAAIDWISTTRNEETIQFVSAVPESGFYDPVTKRYRDPVVSEQPHFFAIRAVDNLGAYSEPVQRGFYSFGVAPVAQIVAPRPSPIGTTRVTPAVRINWTGNDFVDQFGAAPEKPLYYKYTLYKRGNLGVNWEAWSRDPDSLRREVAPQFAGWDSIGPVTPEVQYFNLTTSSEYLFVVVAFGRSGAYSPVFSYNTNMLRFVVGLAGQLGPRITFYNSFFEYTYPGGGYSLDLTRAIQLQVPAAQPITFNWFASPSEGSVMKRYRWVMDLSNLDDQTPRTSQDDVFHWSPWSLSTSGTVGPFEGTIGTEADTGEVHNFYLEAEDINGLVSLGWAQFRVYRPTFDRDLLVVNDTRFKTDELSRTQPPGRTDSLAAPSGVWPSRAELDTFLFAVGGVPWKMKPFSLTTGPTLSPPGIFRGYSFDTLGTRMGLVNPTVSLGLLGRYRHVIWMTDRAVAYTGAPNSTTIPIPTMTYMSGPGRQNTLATWVSQGGKMWGLGGGFGNATNLAWNREANDNQTRVYSTLSTPPDLTPGRFMFDLAHWRSEFKVFGLAFVSYVRYDRPDPIVNATSWRGGKFTNPDVDYSTLPTALLPRSPATDPIWPYRNNTEFYVGNNLYSALGLNLEFISQELRMTEEIPVPSPTNPDSTVEVSTLDSLYLAFGSAYPGKLLQSGQGVNAVMTYYHGRENQPVVSSGTSIWDFRRQDCAGLVDFVLGELWGLQKRTFYAAAPRTVVPSLARRPAVPPQTLQRPSGSARQPVGTSTFQRWR